MTNIDEIMERIRSRNSLLDYEKKEDIKIKKDKKISLNLSLILLSFFSLILSFLIYAKKDENGKFIKDKFDIEINFSEVNKVAKEFLDKFLTFEYIFDKKNKDQFVGLSDSYIELEENQFTNSSNLVYAIEDGTVTKVSNDEIYVEHDNGIIANYKNVYDICVYKFDRVKEFQILASMNEKINIYFFQNGSRIDYEEIYS